MSSETNLTESAEPAVSVDPDVDLRVDAQRRELVRFHAPVLAVIAFGGGVGASGRYCLDVLLPTLPGRFPWGTFTVNLTGCFLIGVLMVVITDVWAAHRLVRPFLGVGVLGGFTTFSTYTAEAQGLLHPGTVGTAFGYLAGTLIGAMLAVIAGVWLTRGVAGSAINPERTV